MNRRADATARAPGVPGPRGGSAGDSRSPTPHRPVTDALTRAGVAPAAPSDRGDNLSAAGATPASTLVDGRPDRGDAVGRAEGAPLDLREGIGDPLPESSCERWPEH